MTLIPDSQHVRYNFNFGTSQMFPLAINEGDRGYNQHTSLSLGYQGWGERRHVYYISLVLFSRSRFLIN